MYRHVSRFTPCTFRLRSRRILYGTCVQTKSYAIPLCTELFPLSRSFCRQLACDRMISEHGKVLDTRIVLTPLPPMVVTGYLIREIGSDNFWLPNNAKLYFRNLLRNIGEKLFVGRISCRKITLVY